MKDIPIVRRVVVAIGFAVLIPVVGRTQEAPEACKTVLEKDGTLAGLIAAGKCTLGNVTLSDFGAGGTFKGREDEVSAFVHITEDKDLVLCFHSTRFGEAKAVEGRISFKVSANNAKREPLTHGGLAIPFLINPGFAVREDLKSGKDTIAKFELPPPPGQAFKAIQVAFDEGRSEVAADEIVKLKPLPKDALQPFMFCTIFSTKKPTIR